MLLNNIIASIFLVKMLQEDLILLIFFFLYKILNKILG